MPGVDAAILDPRGTWADKADYDATAAKLVEPVHRQFRQVRRPCRRRRSATPRRASAANNRNKSGRPSSAPPDASATASLSKGACRRRPARSFSLHRGISTMSDHEPRLWPHDAAIRAGRRGLPRPHPAQGRMDPRGPSRHDALADPRAARHRRPSATCPDLIRRYNESVGGVNSDTEGYHETITQVLHPRRAASSGEDGRAGRCCARVNALLLRAGGAAGLAAALLLPGAALFGGGAAGVGGAGFGGALNLAGPAAFEQREQQERCDADPP